VKQSLQDELICDAKFLQRCDNFWTTLRGTFFMLRSIENQNLRERKHAHVVF